jgi:hypothetical protein
VTIMQQNNSIIEQKIKDIELDTLTPIEALNLLSQIKKML